MDPDEGACGDPPLRPDLVCERCETTKINVFFIQMYFGTVFLGHCMCVCVYIHIKQPCFCRLGEWQYFLVELLGSQFVFIVKSACIICL